MEFTSLSAYKRYLKGVYSPDTVGLRFYATIRNITNYKNLKDFCRYNKRNNYNSNLSDIKLSESIKRANQYRLICTRYEKKSLDDELSISDDKLFDYAVSEYHDNFDDDCDYVIDDDIRRLKTKTLRFMKRYL